MLYRVTRLLHPITLAVILVGVAGFLIGLIVAVEKQDAASSAAAPVIAIAEVNRITGLETALAGRDAEIAALKAELTRQQNAPPALPANDGADRRIASLQAALTDNLAEQKALQGELTGLSGQLAEAIQSRDELRAQLERERLAAKKLTGLSGQLAEAIQSLDELRAQIERERIVVKNESANFEQMIAVLRRELNAAQKLARSQPPVAAVQEESPPVETPVAETPTVTTEPPVTEPPEPEPAVAASPAPPEDPPEVTTPAEPSRVDTEESPDPQTAAVPATAGPITRGVAAYQAADYDEAYALWLPPALNGSTRAQFYVGALYFEGRGVAVDLVQSYIWLRAATKNDDPGALKLLDRVRDGMTGAELAEAETRIANGETIPDR